MVPNHRAPVALELQRPLVDDALRIVARGEKWDGVVADNTAAAFDGDMDD